MKQNLAVLVVAFCALFLGLASAADSVLDNAEAQQKARTIFTSGGTYYLSLNTTYLIYYGVLIGLGFLAILALGNLSVSSTKRYSQTPYQPYQRQGQQEYFEEDYLYRQRRFAEGTYCNNIRLNAFD